MVTRSALVEVAKAFRAAVAIAAAAVSVSFLVFSETTVKSIVDRWLAQCVIVLDLKAENSGAVVMQVHAFGDMPKSFPVTVAAKSGTVDRISFVNHVEQDTAALNANVLVHPLANQRCPGDLCPDSNLPGERLTIRITPVSTNYLYQFRVVTSEALQPNDIKLYSKPLKSDDVACRIERAAFSNFIARQTKLVQLFLFALLFVFATMCVGFIRTVNKGV